MVTRYDKWLATVLAGLAGILAAPQVMAQADALSAHDEGPQIQFSQPVFAPRAQISWTINPDGHGDFSVGAPSGWTVQGDDAVEYHFAPGDHPVAIGQAGYDALRKLMGDVLAGKVSSMPLMRAATAAGVDPCTNPGSTDWPVLELVWQSVEPDSYPQGALQIPLRCMSEEGESLARRLSQSWSVIARLMVQAGQPGVVRVTATQLSAPTP